MLALAVVTSAVDGAMEALVAIVCGSIWRQWWWPLTVAGGGVVAGRVRKEKGLVGVGL